MKTDHRLIREHIQAMPAYQPVVPRNVLAKDLDIPAADLIKLDANENPFGPLPQVTEELGRLANIHLYPDPESRQIRKELSIHHRIPMENIIAGAGADELIDLILRILIDPGDYVINCPPTFGMYAFDSQLNQARIIKIPRRLDFSVDVAALERAIWKFRPKVVFLANPNNPDGGILPYQSLERLANLPCLIVIDEAYIEFSVSGTSALELVAKRSNVVVLRTLSKWAGLAGLRIGYGVFPTLLAATLMKAKQPYNVSVAAERAAVVTMQRFAEAEARLKIIREQRDQFLDDLTQISWLKPYPSEANFILCKVTKFAARDVRDRLRNQAILVRFFDQPGLENHLRMSIGSPSQMVALLAALKGVR